MALQKVNRNLLNTGVSDSSDATAITIDSSENVTLAGSLTSGTSVTAPSGFLGGSNGGIRIHAGGTKFFNITAANAARDNIMDIGASDARFKDLYLGGGIYLGGTGSANKLTDYEEGTWTPTVNDGTISQAAGYYTKVGRMVTVSYFYILTTLGSSNTTVQIGGLPFTSGNLGDGMQTAGSVLCRYFSKNQIVSYVGNNASYLQYYNNTTTDFDAITFGEIEVSYDNDFSAHGTHTYFI